eukprot:SAG31_NODE_5943_length_2247_cov_1.319367_3_plen_182_part_00
METNCGFLGKKGFFNESSLIESTTGGNIIQRTHIATTTTDMGYLTRADMEELASGNAELNLRLKMFANVGKKLGPKGRRFAEAQTFMLAKSTQNPQPATDLRTAGGALQHLTLEQSLNVIWQERKRVLRLSMESELQKVWSKMECELDAGKKQFVSEIQRMIAVQKLPQEQNAAEPVTSEQ